jgi:NitT/TauT family transport system substrate-binding protein
VGFATPDTLKKNGKAIAGFVRATAKGWYYAQANRDQAVDLLVKEYPNLVRQDEREALDVMLTYAFTDTTRTEGWGTMDPAVWQDQIKLYSDLGQFTKRTPKLEEVMTLDILKATADARPKIG